MDRIGQVVRWTSALVSLFVASGVSAQCINVVDVRTELPYEVVTPNGTSLSYFYNLESEQYLVLWARNDERGGPYGPFTLTRGCAPAELRWESDRFVLLEAGCGTFCWGVEVLPLIDGGTESLRIFRPLAFDRDKNLIAFYADLDLIRIRNLETGVEQDARTALECDTASGLCIHEIRFVGNALEYQWRYDQTPKAYRVELDAALIGN